ncbi:hypothetical protein [Bacillus gaemokensis]|uniref:Uncharacterized protein n=1 Tax=Bacillus gaemokensis TaxID=574375 RepID=A0A073KIF8_9BACI|nr:hypothetical protein [Bacillus gaemokensis]KEK22118.1 hypothetical protein BAGA_22100 [Bacillus gaemokensis]KYG35521.1 hypothetical protein AZF08_26645 [Bacillus gaemokensis]
MLELKKEEGKKIMDQKMLELLNEIYPVDIIKAESVTDEMFRCTAEQGNYFARITNYKNYDEQLEEVNFTKEEKRIKRI